MQALRGMRDILPSEIPQWQWIESLIARWMERYAYHEIRTPMLEYADLFYHGVGDDTDAVGKEMYIFSDRGGDQVALRPELTAPVARAILQHALHKQSPTLRLWYYGACFRYERPQKGRQRQFHQVGAECIGYREADADTEIIALAWDILSDATEPGTIELVLNTLGTEEEQRQYRDVLVAYLERYASDLSEVSQQRLRTNPLRILDSKDERDRSIINAAPTLHAMLSPESRVHYDAVKELLAALSIPFREDPFLVRGLDYYTHTVFEFRSTRLGAQDAVGGGGRYDQLLARLGGEQLPGVGFGIGVERLLLASNIPQQSSTPLVYVAADRAHHVTLHRLTHTLRQKGIACTTDLQFRSLKAQLRYANKLGCSFAILLGVPDGGEATIKNMETGEQLALPLDADRITEHVATTIIADHS
ncbi:MAG: histidine--tRNA ligase [Candidatus Kapaibacterium sp.]|nr:MAG: histidine--tRNA ligase [Candidatus Kapabacteria bacterium]